MKPQKRMRKLGLSLAIATAIASSPLTSAVASPGSPNPKGDQEPNVIVIMADDIGYGDLSCYGARSISTPNLDRLADNGVKFTNAYSDASTCSPSRFALITGKYAWRQPDTGIANGTTPLLINKSTVTIADVMKNAGYRTAAIGKWHLGLGPSPGGPNYNKHIVPGPAQVGFEYSYIFPATLDRVPTVWIKNGRVVGLDPSSPIEVSYRHPIGSRPTGKKDPQDIRMAPSFLGKGSATARGHDDTIINGIPRIGWMSGGKGAIWKDSEMSNVEMKQVVGFIKRNKDHRFFLYFASHDDHVPRVPAPRFVGTSGMGPRGDLLLELDWEVGRIESTLKRFHIWKNTLVIFTSDNGPVLDDGYEDGAVELAEHPITTPYNKKLLPVATHSDPYPVLPAHKPAGPFSGGKYSILEGGTRVPFIVDWPGHTKKGMTSAALISQLDLLASFAALTHQPIVPSTGPDSVNILPTLLGQSTKGVKQLVIQMNSSRPLALVRGHWVYIQSSNGPAYQAKTQTELGNEPVPQLYDLSVDVAQAHNVASKYPREVHFLQDDLEQVIARKAIR